MFELKNITKSSGDSDIVMVYFSGHGGIDSTIRTMPFIFADYFNNRITLNDIIYTLNADNAKTILWF
ncbi:MAG: caspase family protein [Saprospiraceae bacterium]|nr:caspase family protein [Saprospiraceae bacterium]